MWLTAAAAAARWSGLTLTCNCDMIEVRRLIRRSDASQAPAERSANTGQTLGEHRPNTSRTLGEHPPNAGAPCSSCRLDAPSLRQARRARLCATEVEEFAIEDPGHLLRQFLMAKKWSYAVANVSIILSEIVMVQFPRLLGEFTNAWGHRRLTPGRIMDYALELLLVGVVYVLLFGVGQMRNGRNGREFEYLLRKRLFDHWETLSAGYFRKRSVGDLLNHALNDVRAVREALSGGMNILTNSIFLLAATLYMTLTTINVKLTLMSLIPILFVPLLVIWWGPRIRDASRQVQESLSDMADLTEESLSAISLVKATANERVETERFTKRVDQIVHRQLGMIQRSAMFQSFIPLLGSLSFAIALLYGGYLTVERQISLGAFVAFTLYLAMIITPLQQIGFVINNFQRASASMTRLRILMSEAPDIRDPDHASPHAGIAGIIGDIDVRLASFTYPDGDNPVLQNIVFSALRGQTVGIVGRTGSGKTTLVNLLPRIFDPPPGSVFLDGRDIRELPLSVLRAAIAYVPQDGFLFSTSLGENIGFSSVDATPKAIEQAARDAAIYEDIMRFRDGMDTQIGERGVTLSGGQKQRTAIARALLKNAPILLLDDSLSAVDMNTEKRLITRLRQIRQGKTTLIIAHRLSAVRHADLILVLDGGELAESGTHADLIRRNGVYSALYRLQHDGEAVTG